VIPGFIRRTARACPTTQRVPMAVLTALGLIAMALTSCGSRIPISTAQAAGGGIDQRSDAPPTGASSTNSTASGSSPTVQSSVPIASGLSVGSAQSTTTIATLSGAIPPTLGTYYYTQSGSTSIGSSTTPVPQQGTIVIDPAVSGGAETWNQTWHSYVDPSQPPTDTAYRFSPNGISIISEVIRQSADGQNVTFTCTFTSPVKVIPWPIRTGYSFAGTADCGSFTLSLTGQITSTQQVTLDGGGVTV